MEVQVLGTSFDVMAYVDEKSVNTTLVEGAVNVHQGNTSQRLQPGQQAVLDPVTGAITVHPADVDQVIAWKTGFFEFDNAPLSDIMRQLSRWYDIDVNYSQADNSRLFGGRISRNLPLSDILHMLEANGPKFLLSGRKLIVK
jgi:ferric-dicitrate binding protein FerR (iron transport regulator)